RRRWTVGHHPQVSGGVAFSACVVVVVVNHGGDIAADDLTHAFDDPFATRIGIAACELHCGDVAPAQLAVLVDDGGRHMHAILPAGQLEGSRGAGMAQSPPAEMDAHPDQPALITHQIDVEGPPAYGNQLCDSPLATTVHA